MRRCSPWPHRDVSPMFLARLFCTQKVASQAPRPATPIGSLSAMASRGKSKRPPEVSGAWVAKTAERLAEEDLFGALNAAPGKRWKVAQAAAHAEVHSPNNRFAAACEVLYSNRGAGAESAEIGQRACAQAAAEYARKVLAAKALSFEGPTGLQYIDGRPVQA